jgi:hypothetical protein
MGRQLDVRTSLVVLLLLAGGAGCSQYKDSVLYCCTDAATCPQIVLCDRDPARPMCDQAGTQGPTNTCVAGPDAMQGCSGPQDCSGATPVCRTSDRTCVECLEDTNCPTAEEPVCMASNTCGGCTIDADCAGRGDGRINCDTSSGACEVCVDNGDCSASAPICDGSTQVCRGCAADAECTASGVCNLEAGTCVAQSDVLYVERTATAGNMDCTSAAPCSSITKAVTAASGSRKWILVKADATSYQDSVDLTGTRAKEVVIKGAGATVDATPDDVPAFSVGFLAVVVANVRIEGLTITGGFDSADADGIFCSGSGSAKPVLTLVGVTVRTNTGSGVEASNCNLTVTRSTLNGNMGGAISVTSSSFTITNNFIFDNGDENASAYGGVQLASIAGDQASPLIFSFNTLLKNKAQSNPPSVFCSGVGKALTLRNNLVWGRVLGVQPDEVSPSLDNCTFHYSLIGPKAYTAPAGATGNVDTSGITADGTSLFMSPTGPFNLHLKAGSAAIDAATDPSATEPIVIDGETRPKGSARDIGADEAE